MSEEALEWLEDLGESRGLHVQLVGQAQKTHPGARATFDYHCDYYHHYYEYNLYYGH